MMTSFEVALAMVFVRVLIWETSEVDGSATGAAREAGARKKSADAATERNLKANMLKECEFLKEWVGLGKGEEAGDKRQRIREVNGEYPTLSLQDSL